MKKFKVTLTRAYTVEMLADNINDARHCAEFFVGNPKDESTEKEQKEYQFKIGEMEMVMNEAMEAEEVKEFQL